MDNISDALIRIKNGYLVGKQKVTIRYSKLIMAVCKVMVEEGYLSVCKQEQNLLELVLKYNNRQPSLTDLKRISKPGIRVYKGANALPVVLNGLGIVIISTPKGVMTGKAAKELKLGGEVLAEVW